MKISIRTVIAITLTVATLAGAFSMGSQLHKYKDPNVQYLNMYVWVFITPIASCLSGASIAYDRMRTLRSAARGALNAFYVWFVIGMLTLLLLPAVS